MSMFELRHYVVRFRYSERLRYRLPRELWLLARELASRTATSAPISHSTAATSGTRRRPEAPAPTSPARPEPERGTADGSSSDGDRPAPEFAPPGSGVALERALERVDSWIVLVSRG